MRPVLLLGLALLALLARTSDGLGNDTSAEEGDGEEELEFVLRLAQVQLYYDGFEALGTGWTDMVLVPSELPQAALYSVLYNPQTADPALPLCYFFPPLNLSWDKYIRMLVRLANAGYVVVAADTYQGPFPFSIEGGELTNSEACPPKTLVPSAAALSAFTQNLDQFAEALGPKSGPDPEMVLMGSREGAYAAMLVASGQCNDLTQLKDPKAVLLCQGYSGVQGSIKGVVANQIAADSISSFNLPGDAFSLWMVGEWDHQNVSELSYKASSSACNSFVQLANSSVYSWADYTNGTWTGQWPDCVVTQKQYLEAGMPEFTPTLREWRDNIKLTVGIINNAIQAATFGNVNATDYLATLPARERVEQALGTECFLDA